MSLRPEPIGEIPAETARVARAALPKGTVVTRLRDEFSALYRDEDFGGLYPSRGQPALTPWRLALVTVLQFLENLSDRQAADAVRARIDGKYALGLELTDPGLHFSVLTEFRARLVAGNAEQLLLDRMLERFKARGLVKARGKQRTDSTHVLAAVHDLHLLELVGETLRAALDDLAAAVPDWLRAVAPPAWFGRYTRRIEAYRLPQGREAREALALEIGADGVLLLAVLDAPAAPAKARAVPMVRTPREVWRVHYACGDDGQLRWRKIEELPPVAGRMQAPHDPEAHFSMKRQLAWVGYKVHVTETCDDDAAHLVTDVTTCPAMQPDMTSTAGIHQGLAAKGLLPAGHFVDSAYVDAALLAGSRRDHGVPLEGPVRGTSSRPARAGQDPMRAASGGLTRSRMVAPIQEAEDRSMGTERDVAEPGTAPTVFLAVELSKAGWVVALHTPAAARVSMHRLPAGDAEALLAFAERARTAAANATGGAEVAVASCYEAGHDGFWLHRVLVAGGIANLVVDPASLQVDRRARRAKTDRIDAQALLRALMAHHRGEPRVWSPVHVPTPADEDARRTHRERQNLVKERGRHVNRIKGLCAQQGIHGYEPIRPDRHERLAVLVTGDGRPLPPRLRAEIGRELRRLEVVLEQIEELEAERDAAVRREAEADAGRAARIGALMRLKGIGPETAAVLGNEGFYRRFANRRQLAAYVGLAPSPYRSGGLSRDQGISRAGNPRARTAVVELAWLWLRHQPGSPLSAWFVRRVGSLKGRIKRIMVVALARKLLLALWRYLKTGLAPEGATLKG